jgi:hypothetical protein
MRMGGTRNRSYHEERLMALKRIRNHREYPELKSFIINPSCGQIGGVAHGHDVDHSFKSNVTYKERGE